jgi:MmgE/PrpD N-terminal domain
MTTVKGQLAGIESKHSGARADRRTFLRKVALSAASVGSANAAFGATSRDSRQAPVESHLPEKPKPISSGPSQAEGIAGFARRARYEDLTPHRRERLKVSVLDSLACAINALGAPPTAACLAQARDFGGPGGRWTASIGSR